MTRLAATPDIDDEVVSARSRESMRLELVDAYSPRVEEVWRDLEQRAKPSFFLTWGWMENWLACLPKGKAPKLAIVMRDGQPIGACFLGERRVRRHHVVRSRALFVNNTGLAAYDELCLEHNAMLGHGVSFATLVSVLPGTWDELYLPAVDAEAFASLTGGQLGGLRAWIDREVANYHVDLEKVREGGYVPLLGSSTRAQIRKAQRQAGEVTFDVAADDKEALDIYGEMVMLHQRSWQQRGETGAFADPWFDKFHRRLIAQRFKHGDLQLVRLRTKEMTLGCLYNFVAAKRVLFYQCGFGIPTDRHVRPGYLCHTQAIEHSAKLGLDIYDLLGGDARYKKSLATNETRLVWGRVQKTRLRFALEDLARGWAHKRRGKRPDNGARDGIDPASKSDDVEG